MENLMCLDSSVLIDFFRKQKSERSFFIKITESGFSGFYIAITVEFEIYFGATPLQKNFWDNLFHDFIVLPYTQAINAIAIDVAKGLKRGNIMIDYKDLTIAATALHVQCPLGTINAKHFKHIKGLSVISPDTIT
jgi:predicted nucleic acid-binding protein